MNRFSARALVLVTLVSACAAFGKDKANVEYLNSGKVFPTTLPRTPERRPSAPMSRSPVASFPPSRTAVTELPSWRNSVQRAPRCKSSGGRAFTRTESSSAR